MSKIKLSRIVKEVIEQEKKKQTALQRMSVYEKKMDQSLKKLKQLMRRDGYDI